jgi:hypothetical protein
VCVYSLGYPARNAHAPLFHLRLARLYKIPPLYQTKGMIFEKEIEYKKVCFNFLYPFFENIYHSEKN